MIRSKAQSLVTFSKKWGVRVHAGAAGTGVSKRLVAVWEEENATNSIVPLFQSKGPRHIMHVMHEPTY